MRGASDSAELPRLSAIVLAAGESRRMGRRNKLLLSIGGVALVRRSVDILAACEFVELVVVIGHEREAVAAALDGLEVRTVFNVAYGGGQTTSVRAGLRALTQPSEGVMICLADQPAIDRQDIEVIRRAFGRRGTKAVTVPTYAGKRGNPIVLQRSRCDEILKRQGNFACRQFIEKNAALVATVEMDCDHVVVDVDRAQDYEAWSRSP